MRVMLYLLGPLLGCGNTEKSVADTGEGTEASLDNPDDDNSDTSDSDTSDPDTTDEDDTGTPEPVSESAGCGLAAPHGAGGVQLEIDAGTDGDGWRGYWLSRPASYDPNRPYGLIVGLPGTNSLGQPMVWYLGLEGEPTADDFIFVYPDPLWRDFDGWGNLGGWVLGPHAYPADGTADITFMDKLLDEVEASYCIDTARVFATGHSWGGDMAAVVGCFMGDRVRAAVPAAANRPYWFETGSSAVECVGDADIWTFYGIADDHFAPYESYPGDYGDQQVDFWLGDRDCDGWEAHAELGLGGDEDECVVFDGCRTDTHYCLYGPDTGHQIPPFFSSAVMDYFSSY